MAKRKPVSVTVVEEGEGRVLILKYANGDERRAVVDPNKKPARKPRRPPQRLKTEGFNRTRQKSF
jgi:hypothetical protein